MRTSNIIAAFLGEPEENAEKIADETLRTCTRFWCDFALLAYGTQKYFESRLSNICCNHADVKEFVETIEGPIVILSLHMGNFMSAGIRMAEILGRERDAIIFRRLEETEMEQKAFAHIKARVRNFTILRHSNRSSATRALAALRLNGVLMAPMDLPPVFGVSKPVKLFGQQIHMTSGPIQLAVATHATIIMAGMGTENDGREVMSFHPAISAKPRPSETRQEAVTRLMQLAADMMESQIRRYPGEWLMWPYMPTFLSPPSP